MLHPRLHMRYTSIMPSRCNVLSRALIALALILIPVGHAFPNRYHDNPAIAIADRSNFPVFYPINEVGKIDGVSDESIIKTIANSGEFIRGTAFNISPCLMAMNHHGAYGDSVDPSYAKESKLIISAGVSSTKPFQGRTLISHVEVAGVRTEQGSGDWAVVKSPACLGKAFGWYTFTNRSTRELLDARAEVFVVSYPGDRPRGTLEIAFGNITGIHNESGMLKYNASVAPGSSGGPVFTIEDGQIKVVGLHKGGSKINGTYIYESASLRNINTFVPSEYFMAREDIKAIVALDQHYNGSNNKALPFTTTQVPDRYTSVASGRVVLRPPALMK